MKSFKSFFAHPVSIILLTIVILILIYLVMLWNTNSIIDYAKAVFRGEIQREQVENTPWNRYDKTHTRDGVAEVEIEISRVFVMHNFFDGYMWVKYRNMGYDESGKNLYGSIVDYPFYSRWKIHKEHGKWVLVEIDEHP